ncbi:MAG TPA: FAD-dependent thymidylate synthase [Candidatus Eisenbacteria bacterium]|nr:FAD-dependent thymidylate synthase [Candidatus Eisenbacteria bacterium]
MPRFTDEEKALLAPYVTDTEGDIFAVTGLQGIVGAVYARYSRAQGGFRETLLKEFIKEGVIDAARAGDLVERVLVAYGDDSVGELEGAHLSFENISILATKEIEDRRIGGSPIEQSTRYVFYDQKDQDGEYRYYRDPAVMASPHAAAYVETMDAIFATYCELVEPMKAYYSGLKPIESAEYGIGKDGAKLKWADCTDEKLQKAFRMTYNSDIRTKACDALRALLPVATKTNVGIYGNGRFFQNVLSHCYTTDIPEAQDIAKRAHAALDKVMPRYVKRAKRNAYIAGTHAKMRALAAQLFRDIAPADADRVSLIGDDAEHVARALNAWCGPVPVYPEAVRAVLSKEKDYLTIATMLYPYLRHPLSQIRAELRKIPQPKLDEVVATYVGERATRRDRPGRALETGYPYTFDLVTDFGTYKDLERHRMMTQSRQAFTPTLGFAMPPDLVAAGFEDRVRDCIAKAVALYGLLKADYPEQAAYATLHGSLVRWSCGINDRALMHLIELRTQPAGHPSYRKVCQEMHDAVSKASEWRGKAIAFADHNDYFWTRAEQESRQRVKEAALEKK